MNYSTEKTEKYPNNKRQKTSEKLTPTHKSKTQGLWIDRQGNFVPILLKNSIMSHNSTTGFRIGVITHDGTASRSTECAVL